MTSERTASITVRRTIAASAEEIFDAWLDPESLAEWMQPGPTLRTTARSDARVGGSYEVVMHMPGEHGSTLTSDSRCSMEGEIHVNTRRVGRSIRW
jgi:uncharacterized protein YndB with AHSA1/START domain